MSGLQALADQKSDIRVHHNTVDQMKEKNKIEEMKTQST